MLLRYKALGNPGILPRMWSAALEPYIVFAVPAAVIAVLIALVAIALLIWEHRRLSRLMLGRTGTSLEESIVTLARRTRDLEGFRAELEQYLKRAEARMASSIRGVGTVRFNPFKGDGSGGNQSFATALITEQGDGVIFSTLYSRERVSTYGKPVRKGASEFELSDEEKEALRLAREQAAQ